MKTRITPVSFISLALICFLAGILFPYGASAIEIHRNIQGPFASIADVTTVCLKCHRQQAIEVLESVHWTWIRQRLINGKKTLYGKKDALTGFAIDVSSNPSRCMGCHISNTRPEVNFDAPTPEMVDCLVCHDTTGTYRQASPGVPNANSPEELETMARQVGKPTVGNCMTCHFADCGLPGSARSGTHSPIDAPPFRDIHLNLGRMSLTCQECHTGTNEHNFVRSISRANGSTNEQGCASCHSTTPHTIVQLNQHSATIACQTCHIPQFAQQDPMMVSWNWIMTGKSNRVYMNGPNGRTMEQDENGFSSALMIEPVYLWDDGGESVYTRGQRIKPQELTYLQQPAEKNPASKITPFRAIYGTQLYDTKYRYLVSPLLQPEGSTFFPGSDWEEIARQGMHAIVLPFSGEFAFVPTVAFRRINHGVVSVKDALGCLDCHGVTGRIPWDELGYETIPWFDAELETSGNKGTTNSGNVLSADRLQPLKNSVKPSGLPF